MFGDRSKGHVVIVPRLFGVWVEFCCCRHFFVKIFRLLIVRISAFSWTEFHQNRKDPMREIHRFPIQGHNWLTAWRHDVYTQLAGDVTRRESLLFSYTKLSYLGEHSEVSQARSLHACWTRMLYHDRIETIENSQSTNSVKTLKIFNVYSCLEL